MKFCKKILVLFVLINILFSVHSVAQNSDDLEQMIRSSKTRAALVQNVQKAVVHIKVEKIVRALMVDLLTIPWICTMMNFFDAFSRNSILQKIINNGNSQIVNSGREVWGLVV